jgi:hypothetical protein
MFLREKKTRVGDRLYSGYFQIIEGYRNEEGKVRHRVVRHLGKFANRQHAARAAVKAGYSRALRPEEQAAIHQATLEARGITRDPRWIARDGEIERMNKGRRRLVNP